MAFQRAEGSRTGAKDAFQLTDEVETGEQATLMHLEERVSHAETWLCRCGGRYWCLREAPPHGPDTCRMVLTERWEGTAPFLSASISHQNASPQGSSLEFQVKQGRVRERMWGQGPQPAQR